MHKELNERQREVLELIVSRYVETAEPVGSRYISRKLDLSSATIRNVMADLEDLGYIMQPHTSAGRAPTDRGYRYFIDSLMHVRSVNQQVANSLRGGYGNPIRSLDDVLERTSHLISDVTKYVGLTLFSQCDKLYLDGASHIIEQPEFHDLKKLYSLLRYLEHKRDLLELLRHDFEEDGLTIHIGRENISNSLADCSIVTKGYKVKGKVSGRLGVIGPKRMMYERVIPAVELLADTVTDIFEEMDIRSV
ncbi:MAG: heat-inducible transcriptional repressor HrcA [Candidatus Omnitrophica bacterium]|nr:heat-inducible transcriptional repressor HrcA [Candidatus Omnitrophota bacterium]